MRGVHWQLNRLGAQLLCVRLLVVGRAVCLLLLLRMRPLVRFLGRLCVHCRLLVLRIVE